MTLPERRISWTSTGPAASRRSLGAYPMGAMRGSVPTAARASISCRLYMGTPSKSGEITAISRSLHGPALPVAYEPNNRTDSTRIILAIRSTNAATTRSSSASVAVARMWHVTSGSILPPFLWYMSLFQNIGARQRGSSAFAETLRRGARARRVRAPGQQCCESWAAAAPAGTLSITPSASSPLLAGSERCMARAGRVPDRQMLPPSQPRCSRSMLALLASPAHRRRDRPSGATGDG